MKTRIYIDAVIENMFKTANERQILKAFFYRVTLNLNVNEVAKELRISQIKVNLLTRSVDSYRLKKTGFNELYLKAERAIKNFASYKVSKEHTKHVKAIGNRLQSKHIVLISKQR